MYRDHLSEQKRDAGRTSMGMYSLSLRERHDSSSTGPSAPHPDSPDSSDTLLPAMSTSSERSTSDGVLSPSVKSSSSTLSSKEDNSAEKLRCTFTTLAARPLHVKVTKMKGDPFKPEFSRIQTPKEIQELSAAQLARLTKEQRDLISRTFAVLERDPVRHALAMFVMMFADHPRHKHIWPQFRAIPDSALMNAAELKKHASVYMTGLRAIIESMEDDKRLASHLKRIARAHIKWNIHKIHLVHQLTPLLEVLRQQCGFSELDDETHEAWTTLYDVIANLIEIYREQERRLSLSSP